MLSFFLSFLFLYRKTLGGFKMHSHSGRRVILYRRERSLHDVVKQANILVQNLELGGEGRGGDWLRSGFQNLERTITTGKKMLQTFE